jgi:hypothetical protein
LCHWIFFIDNSSGRTMALCRLSLWQEWVPGIFPGGKGGRCVGLTTLPPSCADCLKIWEPQTPGTLEVCNGIALPIPNTCDAAVFQTGTSLHSLWKVSNPWIYALKSIVNHW